MKKAALALVIAVGSLGIVAAGPKPKGATPRGPVVEPGFVGHPDFNTRSGAFGAGTAFLIQIEGEKAPLLVTAQHIFGPPGGLKQEVPRSQMPDFVQRATLRDLAKGGSQSTKVSALAIPGDIDAAVFRTTLGTKAKPHKLAETNPKEGDTIWLVASLAGQPRDQILHRGTVVTVFEDKIKCKFDDGNLVTRGASGAPYINQDGDVVGLHTGSFRDPGNAAGAVLPVEAIRKAIQSTLGAQTAAPEGGKESRAGGTLRR